MIIIYNLLIKNIKRRFVMNINKIFKLVFGALSIIVSSICLSFGVIGFLCGSDSDIKSLIEALLLIVGTYCALAILIKFAILCKNNDE